jgi:hypothetical protein
MRNDPAGVGRAFGVPVGSVLIAVSAIAGWRGRIAIAEMAGGAGLLLAFLGWLQPRLLHRPGLLWRRFAIALGYINTRIILTVAFVVILVPLGLLWRVIGRDPLARRRNTRTGWAPTPARYRDRSHYARMY